MSWSQNSHDSHFREGVKGVRICMSDHAAEKLSEKLGEILEDACRRGEMKVQAP
jgi:hypothetical protein